MHSEMNTEKQNLNYSVQLGKLKGGKNCGKTENANVRVFEALAGGQYGTSCSKLKMHD